MTTVIKLKQSNVPGRTPTTGQLEFGEAALNTADGKIFIKKAEFANTANFAITALNNGVSDYIITGTDRTGSIASTDGNISIQTGDTLVITNDSIGHPLYLKTAPGAGTGDQIFNATGQGADTGTSVSWTPQADQTGTFYYQCSNHATMVGTITVTSGISNEQIVEFSADPQDILNLIKTVDGANSGLDADLLDGQSGDYYLDYNNFTNVPPATLDLTLTGKVTGTAFSNTGIMTLVTELANTGVTPGTYGSASLVPILTIDEDGRITVANTTSVAGVSATNWYSANNTFVIQTADGGVFKTPINEFADLTVEDLTANSVNITSFSTQALTVNGNITANNATLSGDLSANNVIVSGLVDGRDIAADGLILDGLATATTTVNLTGDIEGSAVSNNGVIDLVTELTDTGVTPGTYGSSSQIPIITVDVDGRVTLLSNTAVAGVESFTWISANNTLRLETGDGTVRFVNVNNFTNLTVNGDITVTGTVDGRDIAGDGSKLDGIEAGATADMSNTEIFNAVLSLDGALSGLDADLLDGLHASEILASAANTAAAQVGDATITIAAGDALSGGGTFTTNQFNNQTITINHEDVSAQANVDNSAGVVIQDLLFDQFGHVVGVTSTDLDTRFALNTVQIIAGGGLTGGGPLTANVTIEHADTSSVTDYAGAADPKAVVDGLTFDTYGHTLTRTFKILDMYTTAEADAAFVDVTGDTMTGNLEVQADIIQDYARLVTATASSTNVFPVQIFNWTAADYATGEITISCSDANGNQITKMLIVTDGTNAYATEFGNIATSNDLANFEVGISSGSVVILALPTQPTNVTYKIFARLVE